MIASHNHRNDATRKRMAWAMALAAAYMGAEIVGGILSNSLALLADAVHMATDVAALGLALWAMWLASRPATEQRTYGYHRAEILAALLNAAALIALTGYVFWEAIDRLRNPPEVLDGVMLAVALGGLAVNAVGAWLLHGGRHANLNVRGAWLHVVGDALGSVAVIVGALLIRVYGWAWADPVAGMVIGALIVVSAWRLLGEAVRVLMAVAPKDVDVPELRAALCSVPGVQRVHDLHVWTLTSGIPLMTAHVEIADRDAFDRVVNEVCGVARERFGIDHCTIQPEVDPCVEVGGEPCA